MKFVQVLIMALALTGAAPGFAKVEQCRFIASKPDREACYSRQDKALEAKKADAAAKAAASDSLVRRSPEDEAIARQLRSICRGC